MEKLNQLTWMLAKMHVFKSTLELDARDFVDMEQQVRVFMDDLQFSHTVTVNFPENPSTRTAPWFGVKLNGVQVMFTCRNAVYAEKQ